MDPSKNRESRAWVILHVGIAWMAMGSPGVAGCTNAMAPAKSRGTAVVIPDGSDDAPPVCTQTRASGTAPLIDNFDAGKEQILDNDGRDGFWFSYDDGTGGKLLREVAEVPGDEGKGQALHVVSSGFTKWGAGFGVNLRSSSAAGVGCAYDAAAYSGVQLRARGSGGLRITLGDLASTPTEYGGTCTRPGESCYDRPGMWLKLEAQWKTFEIPFCSFVSEGWGGSAEGLDPSKLLAFHFRIGEQQDAEVWLDELTFFRDAPDAPARHCGPACPLDAVPASAIIDPSRSDSELTQELSLHTFEQSTKSCGSITRRYLSYVPSRLPPGASAPVLFVLHGSGANAEITRTYLARNRFDALAERDGFVVVYGNAAPGMHTSPDSTILNSGSWRQGYFDDGQVDDVDYLERVLTDLTARGVIDGKNAVYLTGLSNGGGMALEGARRLAERVRGVAALMPYDGQHPKPVPDLTHAKLKRVLFAYTPNDPGLLPGYHETLARLPAEWAAAMGLPPAVIASPRKTSLPDAIAEGRDYRGNNAVALATRSSRVTQLDMVAPNGDGQVRVLIIDHAGHLWPNPTPLTDGWILDRWGFRNQDFDAADMVCDFLRIARE